MLVYRPIPEMFFKDLQKFNSDEIKQDFHKTIPLLKCKLPLPSHGQFDHTSTYTFFHFVPFYLQLQSPAFPGSYSPEGDYLIKPQGATGNLYSSSECPRENTKFTDQQQSGKNAFLQVIHSYRRFGTKPQKSPGRSIAHLTNPVSWLQLSPALTVLASSYVLLLVRSELTLTLKIRHTHPCATMLSDTKIKSVFYVAHSGCRSTDMKALTQKSLV